ncbi:MAG: YdcH family protein [Acidobacteria bacterium]|jgi:uncharacterized protein YdcH (DUF465 family)|nr:YdcH family protein [Acidobacteriota bacterium]MBP8273960.1 YdcH family protein [Acidobacteriota bacterium]
MTEAQDLHQLLIEHHQLDEQVRHYSALPHPTEQEQLEEAALKKRKLHLKDLIDQLARERAS